MAMEIPIDIVVTPRNVAKHKAEVIRIFNDIEREADKTSKKVGRTWEGGFSNMLDKLKKVRAGWLAVGAAISGVFTGGFIALTRNAINAADNIVKTADRVGLLTDELQRLRFASEQSSIDIRTFDMAMQRFARRTGEVDANMGELLKTAQRYNVEVRDSEGRMKTQVELLGEWADIVKNASSEQERLAIAFKLFDSEGAKLVELLRQGKEGIQELMDEADRLGVVISEKYLRDAVKAADAINKLEVQLKATFNRFVVQNAESIAIAVEKIVNFIARMLPDAPVVRTMEQLEEQLKSVNDQIERLDRPRVTATEEGWKFYGSRDVEGGLNRSPEADARRREELVKIRAELEKEIALRRQLSVPPPAIIPPPSRTTPEGRREEEFIDVWRPERAEARARERYEIQSRALERMIENEQEAVREAEGMRKDSWQIQAEERVRVETETVRMIEEMERQHAERITEVLQTGFSPLKDSLTELITTGKLGFKDMVDSMMANLARLGVNKIFQWLVGSSGQSGGGALGGFVQGILGFQKGGIITRPTAISTSSGPAVAGEGGHPEAIMRLARDRQGNLGLAGGAQVVNIYNITAMDTQSIYDSLKRSNAVPSLAAGNIRGNGILRDAVMQAR